MTAKIIFNGKEYSSVDEMPPEARQAFEQAMSALSNVLGDRNQNGIPDIVESAQPAAAQPAPAVQPPARPAPAASPAPVVSGEVEQGDRNLRLLIVGVVLLALMGLAALVVAALIFNQYVTPQ
jgi:hypothetical protein